MSDQQLQVKRDGGRVFECIAIVIYAAVVAFVASRHEPWHDELQAWRIAIDSDGLGDLLRNLRYEGHPPLWYLILHAVGRFSGQWAAVMIVHVAIAVTTAWLILRYSPFSRWHRLAIISGYFFLFEYAVVARSYGLGAMLAVAAATAWCAPRRRAVASVLSLVLLANTSAIGLVLAMGMSIGFGFDWWRDQQTADAASPRSAAAPRKVYAAGMIAVVTIVVAAVQMLPPPSAPFQGKGVASADSPLNFVGHTMSTPARAFLPVADRSAEDILAWGTWRLEPKTRLETAGVDLLSVMIFFAGVVVVCRRMSALVLWSASFGGLVLFFTLFYAGSLRHHGYLVIALVIAAWLACERPSDAWPPLGVLGKPASRVVERLRGGVLLSLLLPMSLLGVQMTYADAREIFADGQAVSELIRAPDLRELPIIGLAYPQSQAVAALSDRAVYLVHERRMAKFVNSARYVRPTAGEDFSTEAERVVRRALETRCRVLLLTDARTTATPWIRDHARQLHSLRAPLLTGNGMDVWLVSAPPTSSCAS